MKLAFSKPTRSDEDQLRLFEHYGPVGFDGLQLKRGQYSPYLADPPAFKAKWAHLPGVASALISAGGLDEPGVADLRGVIAFAAAVDSERVIFCHTVPRDGLAAEDLRSFAKTLSDLGRKAQDLGVKLSLHHHYQQPVMNPDDLEVFFDAATAGAVGLTVDTAHAVKSGIHDVAGLIRDFREAIDNFHLKDYADGEWRVLGEGGIDFGPIFDAIRDTGYDGWVSADEESGSEVLGGMSACYAFLSRGLGEEAGQGGREKGA